MRNPRFEFIADIEKAYKDDGGNMHVVLVASDNIEDKHKERMSTRAIKQMVKSAQGGDIPLLPTHRSTFEIGFTTVQSSLQTKGDKAKFIADVQLDEGMDIARKLFKEVSSGSVKRQASIGGFLNRENPKAIKFEKRPDGTDRPVIDDIILDHIAVTRKDHAANSRTGFIGAIIKSFDDSWGEDDGEWGTAFAKNSDEFIEEVPKNEEENSAVAMKAGNDAPKLADTALYLMSPKNGADVPTVNEVLSGMAGP